MDGSQANDGSYTGFIGHYFLNGKPHTHSHYAYMILKSLAIAKLEIDTKIDLMIEPASKVIHNNPNYTIQTYENQSEVADGDIDPLIEEDELTYNQKRIFTCTSKHELGTNIHRFTLKTLNPQL